MSEFQQEPRSCSYRDIAAGMKEEREYVISPCVYSHFIEAFDDRSPLHVDEAYARACGFPGKVMHGAILNGFLSHFIGMHFPGRPGMLLSADLRFAQPCHAGDMVRLEATVAQKLDVRNVIILDLIFQNVTRDCIAARGRAQVMVRDEP
jgi:3-hydroxybutyryl-CoA dehydratase